MSITKSTLALAIGLTVLTVTGIPSVIQAQSRSASQGGLVWVGTRLGLQQAEEVLKDMDLTPDQRSKVAAESEEFTKYYASFLKTSENLSAAQRQQKLEDAKKEATNTLRKITKELTPPQVETFSKGYAHARVRDTIKLATAMKTAAGKFEMDSDERSCSTGNITDLTTSLENLDRDSENAVDLDSAQKMADDASFKMDQTRSSLQKLFGEERYRKFNRSARLLAFDTGSNTPLRPATGPVAP